MKFLKNHFSIHINFYQIILLALFGILLSLTINSIFVYTGFIKLELLKIPDNDILIYIIAFIIRVITSCIIGPIIEEIIFRGVLFNFLSKKFNVILSAILTIIIFSLIHLSISTCVFALIVGSMFIYFYIKTNNLFVSFIIHSFCNMMSLIVVLMPNNILYIVLYIILTITLFLFCKKYVK